MTTDPAGCSEDVPALSVGVFRLWLERDGEPARDVGNVVVGNLREAVESFEGCPADASELDRRTAYQVRSAVEIVCQLDEFTCENLLDWLTGPAVNVAAGTRFYLQAVQRKALYRMTLRKSLCDSELSVVIHRAYIASELDLLFSVDAFSGQQLVFRALRDPSHPTNPYGYVELTPAHCGTS